jgi:sphingosine kinase
MCTFCLHSNSLQTLIRIVNLRRYNGSFSYLPAEHLGGTGGPYSSELEVNKLLQNNEADSARSWRKGYSGPLQSHPGSDWRSMDGVFVLVWLNNVPFAGETAMPAPLAKVLYFLWPNISKPQN